MTQSHPIENTTWKTSNPPTVVLVAPILPGKAEAWRRFTQEMLGSRRRDYEASRRRLGIRAEHAWISESPRGDLAIMTLVLTEVERLDQVLARLAASEHPFDRWLRRQMLELHGLDVTQPPPGLLSELIFEWRDGWR
jgi:hypothetical protein